MKIIMKTNIFVLVVELVACLFFHVNSLSAQTISSTAFTYQGRLNVGGAAATGSYDLTFALFADSNGVTQVGNTLTNTALAVSNGQFIAGLDFGSNPFGGQPLWLQIGARTNGGAAFTGLSPLQPLTPVPGAIYSISSGTAGSATNLLGVLPATRLSGLIPLAALPASVITNNASGATLNGTFSGDGSALTGVNSAISNTTNNPIPVAWTQPLPVYDVNNPWRQPAYLATSVIMGLANPPTNAFRGYTLATVPAGERLVIESISAVVGSPGNPPYTPDQFSAPPNYQYGILIQTALTPYLGLNNEIPVYGSNSCYSWFSLSSKNGALLPALTQMEKLYADPGTTISLSCFTSSNYTDLTPVAFYVAISGYYIPTNLPAIAPVNFDSPTNPPAGGTTTSGPGQ